MLKSHYPKQDFMHILGGFLDSLEQSVSSFKSTFPQKKELDEQAFDLLQQNLEKFAEPMGEKYTQAIIDLISPIKEEFDSLTPEQQKQATARLEAHIMKFAQALMEKLGENPSQATLMSVMSNQLEVHTSKISIPEIDEATITDEDIARDIRIQEFQAEHGSIFPLKISHEQRAIWAVIMETQGNLEALIPQLAKREVKQREKLGQNLAIRKPHNHRHVVESPDDDAEYLSSQHFEDWCGYFKQILRIDIANCLTDDKKYRHLRTLRNAIEHPGATVTKRLQRELKKYANEDYQVGQLIIVGTKNALEAIQCLGELGIRIGIKLIQQYEPQESGELLFKRLEKITSKLKQVVSSSASPLKAI